MAIKPLCSTCNETESVEVCQEIAEPIVEDDCCKTGVMTVCVDEPDVPHTSPCCEETHCEDEEIQTVSKHWIKTLEQFNFPACQETATIKVDDASGLTTGHQLYAEGVGYLSVVSTPSSISLVVKNDCLVEGDDTDCNSIAPGEPVPECTKFGVGIKPCLSQIASAVQQNGAYLASDFVIPAVGDCIPVKVTTVDGLSINDRISISGYEYSISAIADATTMTICNDGSGGPVGTLIEDDEDLDGLLDHPIVRIGGTDVCQSARRQNGWLVVCADGEQNLLVPTADNQILQSSGGEWMVVQAPEFQECTTLSADFTVDPASDTHVACLADSSICAGDTPAILIIGGREYLVEDVIDGSKVRLRAGFDVGSAVFKVDAGETACCGDCCAECLEPFTSLDALPYALGTNLSLAGSAPVDLGCSGDVTITNGTCKEINFQLLISSQFSLDIKAGGLYGISATITEDGVAAGPNVGPPIGGSTADMVMPYTQIIPIYNSVAPGQTKTFSVCHNVDVYTASAGSEFLNGGGVIGLIYGTGAVA